MSQMYNKFHLVTLESRPHHRCELANITLQRAQTPWGHEANTQQR